MYFSITSVQVFSLGLDNCIWNRFEALKTWLVSFVKNGRDYLKWEGFCHYEWKFKTQKVGWNACSARKRTNFHFPVGNRPCAYLPSLCTFFPCAFTLWKASDPVMMPFFQYPRNLDIIKYTRLTLLFIFLALPPEKTMAATAATNYCHYGLEIVKKQVSF